MPRDVICTYEVRRGAHLLLQNGERIQVAVDRQSNWRSFALVAQGHTVSPYVSP